MPAFKCMNAYVTDENAIPFKEYGIIRNYSSDTTTCYIPWKPDQKFKISFIPTQIPFPPFQWASEPHPGRWQVLLTVRFNGREKYEIRRVMLLNDRMKDFPRPFGRFEMSGSVMEDSESRLRHYTWRFGDEGIEKLFESMSLSDPDGDGEATRPNLPTASTNPTPSSTDPESQAEDGQIEITLDRINVYHSGDKDIVMQEGQDLANLGHTMTRGAGVEVARREKHWYFDLVDRPDRHFAVFKFFYRKEAVLKRMGFLEIPVLRLGESTIVGQASASGKREAEESDVEDSAVVKKTRWEGKEEVKGEEGEEGDGVPTGNTSFFANLAFRAPPSADAS